MAFVKKILIDLDGVLNEYGKECDSQCEVVANNEFGTTKQLKGDVLNLRFDRSNKFDENFIPDIKQGAYEFLEELSKTAELYLFTTRNLMLSTKWLMKYNLDKFFKDVTNIKLSSYLYIDDRTICFKGNYNKTLEEINNFKVYWKNI